MNMMYRGVLAGALMLLMSQGLAQAACDPTQRALEFQKVMQEAAQKNPSKLAAVQAESQALAKDMPKLMSEGKQDEICKRYDAMEAKLK